MGDNDELGDDGGLLPRLISGLIFPAEVQRRRVAIWPGRSPALPACFDFHKERRRRGVFKVYIQTPIRPRLR